MYQYRVTKYDPAHRAELGHFTRSDWTSFTDVGKNYGGSVLSLTEYERVEGAYVEAALGFLREAGVHTLSVCGVENSAGSPTAPSEGAQLEIHDLAAAMRGVLREKYWCRFEGPSVFVHIGWDYYMYVGVPDRCDTAKTAAREKGLFVESFDSPYYDDQKRGQHGS